MRLTRQARADPAHPHRALHWDYDDEGYLRIRGRLPAELGALFIAAINNLAEHPDAAPDGAADGAADGVQPRSAERGENTVASLATRRADALAALITSHVDPTENTQVIIHLSLEDNLQDSVEDSLQDDAPPWHEPVARIAAGPALPRARAEHLACAGRVRALLTDRARNPLYLGRTRRLVSKTLLAALHFRDHNRCQYPACTHTRWLHAHHIRPWQWGGRTDIDNLILLCAHHHRLVHEHRYRIEPDGTNPRFSQPNGHTIPSTGPTPTAGDITTLTRNNPAIPDDPLTPAWSGERLDPTPILTRLLPELDHQAA